MLGTILNQWQAKVALASFVLLTIFWLILQFGFLKDITIFNHSVAKFFGAVYGIIAIWGGIWGVIISLHWGGIKSVIGKAILMFSIGLFAQEFGQITLSYIDYVLHIQGAYPSIGDVGFFSSIPLYIYGIWLLAQASGVKVRLKSYASKFQAILIPFIMLSIGYYLFLQGYKFDWSNPVKIFLDFGYPLGQAIYISIAILTYLLSRGVLGGIMKNKILFILVALAFQFLSDYTFLYQSSNNIWQVGGINDYMYLCAYFVMTLALLQFNTQSLKNSLNK